MIAVYIKKISIWLLLQQPIQSVRMLIRDSMLLKNPLVTVASHVRHRQFYQGTRIKPTGRFLSSLSNPVGSFVAGISNRLSPYKIRSLIWWWRIALPVLLLHDRLYVSGALCCTVRTCVNFEKTESKIQPNGDSNHLVAHMKIN